MSSAAPEVESPITAGRLRAPYLRTATARHSRPRVVYKTYRAVRAVASNAHFRILAAGG